MFGYTLVKTTEFERISKNSKKYTDLLKNKYLLFSNDRILAPISKWVEGHDVCLARVEYRSELLKHINLVRKDYAQIKHALELSNAKVKNLELLLKRKAKQI